MKSNLICSDYEGVVQLWDVGQQTETMTFEEHAKRVWSVDFSHVSFEIKCNVIEAIVSLRQCIQSQGSSESAKELPSRCCLCPPLLQPAASLFCVLARLGLHCCAMFKAVLLHLLFLDWC